MKPSPLIVHVVAVSICLVLFAWATAPAALAQEVQVTSADPPAAAQGTINLNVTIKGKGFKNGALAKFFVTGTADPGGVRVNSTAFISGSELRANIDVADAATIAKFDIVVLNSNGRSGKGTELFAVLEKGTLSTSGTGTLVRARFATITSTFTPRIRSDGNYADFGLCGVVDDLVDYVDKADPCTNLVTPNAVQASQSQLLTGNLYWLRTLPQCCGSSTEDWEAYVFSPSRWLVLDFSQPEPDSSCPGIDTLVAQHVSDTDWASFGKPTPQPPPADEVTTDGRCVDNVAVRFRGSKFLATGGGASLMIDIDTPTVGAVGRKRALGFSFAWNPFYRLVFRGPLLTTTNAGVTTVQTAAGDAELADLFQFDAQGNQVFVGTYRMPFLLELKPTAQ